MEILDELKDRLEHFLKAQEPDTEISIVGMKPLAGGASRDSWAFTAIMDDEQHNFVLRKDLPTQMNENALTRKQEFALMKSAYEQGVKVANVRYQSDDSAIFGYPFFIMDFVEGISIGRKVVTVPELEHARKVLPEQLAEQLALIHQMNVDTQELSFLARPANDNPAQSAIDDTYTLLDDLSISSPTFELLLYWAQQHIPQEQEITFVHGDFRIGNLLVDKHGLSAVIDWEFAHMGDPCEELAYFCMRDWRFGNGTLQAGGICDQDRWISAYEQYSGRNIDRTKVDWWELVGNIRWGAICLSQANRHLSGQESSVELASLGRRSAEMQLEALNIIKRMEA